jgi:phosphatidylserine decarboxylase
MSPYILRVRAQRHKQFSTTAIVRQQQGSDKESFYKRLGKALRQTKVKWYPIPAALGIGFLGLVQFYKVNEREKAARAEDEGQRYGRYETDSEGKPPKRKRIRPTGPWYV